MVSDRMKTRYDRAANTEGFHWEQLVLLYNPKRKIRPQAINQLGRTAENNWTVKQWRVQNTKSLQPPNKNEGRTIEWLAKHGRREDNEPIRNERRKRKQRYIVACSLRIKMKVVHIEWLAKYVRRDNETIRDKQA